jgi:hypothetical protein
MQSIARDITSFIAEDATDIASRNEALARVVEWVTTSGSPHTNLTSLVTTHLQPYLSSEGKDSDRGRATLLLSRVVSNLLKPNTNNANVINKSTISFLCKFFCGRVKSDYDSVQGCLEALVSLVQRPDLTSKVDALSMLASLKTLHVPQMKTHLRILCHQLFSLLINLEEVCQDIISFSTNSDHSNKSSATYGPNELIEQFCDAMNQESDPRCLKQCFGTATRLLTMFEDHLSDDSIEKMFEVTECYVPIEFVPPPNDTRGITNDDLVNGLRTFYACSPRMAFDVVDMVRDRLEVNESDEPSSAARSDVLWTLSAALPTFCKKPSERWMSNMIPCIQASIDIILSGSEESVVEAALSLIHTTSQQLTVCPAMGGCCANLLSVFVKESFTEAETFRASSAIRGLIQFMTASGYSYELGLRSIVPLAQSSFLSTGLPERKVGIMRHLAMITSVIDKDVVYTSTCASTSIDDNNSHGHGHGHGHGYGHGENNSVEASFPELVQQLTDFARGPMSLYCDNSETTNKIFVIDILSACIIRSPIVLLSLDDVILTMELLYSTLQPTTSSTKEEMQRAMEALVDIASCDTKYTEHILEHLLPGLLKWVAKEQEDKNSNGSSSSSSNMSSKSDSSSSSSSSSNDSGSQQEVEHALETIGMLSTLREIFDVCVPVLLERGTFIISSSSTSDMIGTKDIIVFRAVCNMVYRNASLSITKVNQTSTKLYDIATAMVQLVLSSTEGVHEIVFNDIIEVIRHVVQNMPTKKKTSFVIDTVNTVANKTDVLCSSSTANSAAPLQQKQQKRYRYQMLSVLSTCLCSMNKNEDEIMKIESMNSIFTNLCEIALGNDNISNSDRSDRTTLNIIEVASQAAGSIVNKMPKGELLEQMLLENIIKENSSSLLTTIIPGSSNFVVHARLWSWIAKGLVMKRHPFGTTMCIEFCNVVTDPDYNDEEKAAAVRCISVVMSDSRICLSKECDIYLSSFFKHSLFRRIVPMLLNKISFASDSGSSSNSSNTRNSSNKTVVLNDTKNNDSQSPTVVSRQYHLLHLIMVMITYSPTTVVQSQLSNLLNVVILSLTSKSSMLLQETSLPAVTMVLNNDIQAFAPHAESCCQSLLSLCTVESSASTCISALKCLSLMRGLPTDIVTRVRQDVLSGLWSTLDHPSKMVRRACVVCRNQWFVVK